MVIVREVDTLEFHVPTPPTIVVDVYYAIIEPRLLEMDRSEIVFETSSGDRETVLAPPNEYTIGMEPGRSISDFTALVQRLDGHYTRPLLHQMFVTLVLGPYGRREAETIIARAPGVEYVEYSTRREILGSIPVPTHAFAAVSVGGAALPGITSSWWRPVTRCGPGIASPTEV